MFDSEKKVIKWLYIAWIENTGDPHKDLSEVFVGCERCCVRLQRVDSLW